MQTGTTRLENLRNVHPGITKYYPYIPVAQQKNELIIILINNQAYYVEFGCKMPKPGLVLKSGTFKQPSRLLRFSFLQTKLTCPVSNKRGVCVPIHR